MVDLWRGEFVAVGGRVVVVVVVFLVWIGWIWEGGRVERVVVARGHVRTRGGGCLNRSMKLWV